MTLVYDQASQLFTPSRVCLQGPVNYTVVGNLTLSAGVVTGLTNLENYITLPKLPAVINNFEMVIRCNSGENYRSNFMYSYNPNNTATQARYYGFASSFSLFGVSTASYWMYKPRTVNQDYTQLLGPSLPSGITREDFVFIRLKMLRSGEAFLYSMEYSLDGESWVLLGSQTDTYQMTGDDMGVLTLCANPNNGTGSIKFNTRAIDLNHTYIKINNKLWFGRQQAKTVTCNTTTVWRAQ